MSAVRSDSQIWDSPLYGRDRQGEAPHWFGNLAYVVVQALCKLVTRYSVVHRERLRAFAGRSGAVVVANHKSYLDLAFLYCAARPSQWVRFMGRDNLFHGLVGHLFTRLGAFPVKRDSADTTSVKRAVRMLKNQELVGIFPEGTRRGRGSKTPEVHAGAALIARMAHVPVLPCTVCGDEKIKQKGQPYFHWPKVRVVFGEPLQVGWFDFLPRRERLKAMTWYALRECYAMDRDVDSADVDMAALFPDERDFADAFAGKRLTASGFVDVEGAGPETGRGADDAPKAAEAGATGGAEPRAAGVPDGKKEADRS